MKINLKDNIWIEGFEKYHLLLTKIATIDKLIIYQGKTSEISEELAIKCIKEGFLSCDYMNYHNKIIEFETAKESIQSACDKKYCIIYKEK